MKYLMNRRAIIGCTVVMWMLMANSISVSGAEAPADFFRGKTILWIYSGGTGDSGDLVTRIMASFLAKYIGGKVKVESKGIDEGYNYLYNRGTHDGLTLGTKSKDSIIVNEILKAPGVQYETDKFNFIADVSPAIKMFQISPKLSYKTLDALKKAHGLRAGATSAKGSLGISAAVVSELLGLDAKVIAGFKGKKAVILGIARGETDFVIGTDNSALRDEKDGYLVNLFALGDKRSVAIPHAPTLSELGVKASEGMSTVYKFASSSGLAVAMPPGVPRERVEYMRKVFQTLGDNKELQKELERLTGDRRPFVSGQEVEDEMAEIKSDKELANKLDAIFKKYTAAR